MGRPVPQPDPPQEDDKRNKRMEARRRRLTDPEYYELRRSHFAAAPSRGPLPPPETESDK